MEDELEFLEDDDLDGQSDSDSAADTSDISTLKEQIKHWKSKYAGIKGHAKKATEARNEALRKVKSLAADYEGKLTEVETEKESLSRQLSEKDTTLADIQKQFSALEGREKTRSVVREFASENNVPGLLDLFEEGILRDVSTMDDDARTSYLGKVAKKLGKFETDALNDALDGETPPPPPKGKDEPPKPIKEMQAEIHRLMDQHGPNSPETVAAMAAYEKALFAQKDF